MQELGASSTGTANEFERALRQSLFSAFLLVFGVGFLTCLTPCIYPMIPITLAVLGHKRADREIMFAYACGYVEGHHDITQILVHAPDPHKPQTVRLCERVRGIALVQGWVKP